MLGADTNDWGIPITTKKLEKVEPKVIEEEAVFSIEDLDLTLRFLTEQTEPELSVEEKKDKLLREARLARQDYKYKKEHFCNAMKELGVDRPEVLWADADI